MKKNYYSTRNYDVNHSSFGGNIYNHDFDGHTSMGDFASRIISDMEFDKHCEQEAKHRDRQRIKKGTNQNE